MTTRGLYRSAPGSLPPPAGTKRDRAAAGWRLTRMYLVSRRVPMGLALLAGLGTLLWSSLHWHWNVAGGPAARLFIPLTIQAGAAAGGLPGGTLPLLRNLGGMAGVGLLAAAAAGGAFAWVGPMAYLLITEGALAHRSVTPWIWPTRPPHDRGGAICACLVIAAGLVLITIRGPREWDRESGPAS